MVIERVAREVVTMMMTMFDNDLDECVFGYLVSDGYLMNVSSDGFRWLQRELLVTFPSQAPPKPAGWTHALY